LNREYRERCVRNCFGSALNVAEAGIGAAGGNAEDDHAAGFARNFQRQLGDLRVFFWLRDIEVGGEHGH